MAKNIIKEYNNIRQKDEYCFLLDNYMNWRPNQSATPSLTSALVSNQAIFQKGQ